MISLEDRLDYYLGSFVYSNKEPNRPKAVKHDIPFRTDQNYTVLRDGYVPDINRYKEYTEHNKNFWVQCGDDPYTEDYPALVKFRDTQNSKSKGIIGNLNSVRHWSYCSFAYHKDIPWSNKKNDMIWRGVTTGIRRDERLYDREKFVKDYYDKYDVGFAAIVQSCEHLKEYLRPAKSTQEMLKYKYLVVIDGNDKSSALNWILTSNSIPIMPKPRFHSWLCEPWLVPNVHYIEVQEDYSDLDEKIDWCRRNDKQCEEIAKNGRIFVSKNFTDQMVENTISKKIITRIAD